jgi:hypothetical protein
MPAQERRVAMMIDSVAVPQKGPIRSEPHMQPAVNIAQPELQLCLERQNCQHRLGRMKTSLLCKSSVVRTIARVGEHCASTEVSRAKPTYMHAIWIPRGSLLQCPQNHPRPDIAITEGLPACTKQRNQTPGLSSVLPSSHGMCKKAQSRA